MVVRSRRLLVDGKTIQFGKSQTSSRIVRDMHVPTGDREIAGFCNSDKWPNSLRLGVLTIL